MAAHASAAAERVVRPVRTPLNPLANALRALAMDAVQQARSGHPGAPMGMAEMAVALWHHHLRHDPADPHWWDRDRFVLSNGHASMLLYALLHLTGYDLPVDELRRFRQAGSRTPGHPEVDNTPGVETTTGPLGQGLANAVGLALAEKLLADEFNRPEHTVVDHRTWVFLGDGCLMEGLSQEAISLAGAWKLHKLVALYDDNGISIDGAVTPWFADDTAARFTACGWAVLGPVDGHDVAALDAALAQARRHDRPTLVICRTTIGRGAPGRQGSAQAHGEPLGAEEIAATRAALGWTAGPFELPADIAQAWDARARGAAAHAAWQARWDAYRAAFPAEAAELARRLRGELPLDFELEGWRELAEVQQRGEAVATRKASQQAIARLAPRLPELLGGSADLTASNLTDWPGCGAVRGGQPGGRHIHYGVREFGMSAIMNGIALHGGFIPFGGTFMVFSDYSRNAIRMAALMRKRVVHVLTHDSIGLGEDGPTHQPVEHAWSLRLIPNLDVWRPCDAAETAVAWQMALSQADRPAALSPDPFNVAPAMSSVMTSLAARPEKLFQAQADLFGRYMELWSTTTRRAMGETVDSPAPSDKRFRDPAWSENPMFDMMRQSYLAASDWMNSLVSSVEDVDPRVKRRARGAAAGRVGPAGAGTVRRHLPGLLQGQGSRRCDHARGP